jgi:RIO kinase 1
MLGGPSPHLLLAGRDDSVARSAEDVHDATGPEQDHDDDKEDSESGSEDDDDDDDSYYSSEDDGKYHRRLPARENMDKRNVAKLARKEAKRLAKEAAAQKRTTKIPKHLKKRAVKASKK